MRLASSIASASAFCGGGALSGHGACLGPAGRGDAQSISGLTMVFTSVVSPGPSSTGTE